MLKEFKKFALKGNVMDLAVAVIIGAAFGRIVTSLVNDVIMPVIGLLFGKVDFANLFIVLGEGSYETLEAAKEAGAATLNYGLFINSIINFLIIAFSIFLVIKQMTKLKKKEVAAPAPAPTTKKCPYCMSDIAIDAKKCPFCTSDL
jgi:large conductance mechanosensitive channel